LLKSAGAAFAAGPGKIYETAGFDGVMLSFTTEPKKHEAGRSKRSGNNMVPRISALNPSTL